MKKFLNIAAILVVTLLAQGCAKHRIATRNSFVQVLKTVEISGCGLDAENAEEEKCATFAEFSGVGSGSVVWNERSFGGTPRTLVMTADHVCHDSRSQLTQELVPPWVLEDFRRSNGIAGSISFNISGIDITLRDSRGVEFESNPVPWLRNPEADICIIESSINQRAIPIARGEPEFGERVVNISAPYGLMYTNSEGGAVYITEGNYSGNFSMRTGIRSMYVIWTAPGSSGSPIINERGEIVGLVSAISTLAWPRMSHPQVGVMTAPSNITFGPTLEQIQFSVDEAIAALKRGQPFTYNSSVGRAQESSNSTDNESDNTEGEDFLFPYLFEWK